VIRPRVFFSLAVSLSTSLITALPARPDALQEIAHALPSNSSGVVCVSTTPVTSERTTSDATLLYNKQANCWQKWFAVKESVGDIEATVIKVCESTDGKNWSVAQEPALEPSLTPESWDSGSVESPVVLHNAGAAPDRRFMMWYSGSSGTGGQRDHSAGIGLAFSADGKTFKRVSAAESPYKVAGLVINAQDTFPDVPAVKAGLLAEPRVVFMDGRYQMWFSKIGSGDGGEILSAGVSKADSPDGINWKTGNDPLTFHFDKKKVSTKYLQSKLHRLSSTYSEISM
jgi:predicted GH43/DUF377 family glycosyl hydrolase